MKRWLLVLAILLLILALPVMAQDGHGVYLPIVVKGYVAMSDWKVVVPEATTNKVLNPSAETTGNFAALAGTTVTRVTTYAKWGLYSYRVEVNADNEGISLTLSALANAIHYVTVRVRGTLPAAWDWSVDNSNYTAPALLESLDANWSMYGLQFPAAQCNGSTTLYIRQNGAGSGDFYLDGIQIEEKSYWTTYVDGDQAGCEWNGAEHASTSNRSAQSRAGGRVRDLQTDYSLRVSQMIGTGATPQREFVEEYAQLPGGELTGIKVGARIFTLAGAITGTSWADVHAKRQALISLFDPEAYPEDEDGLQPVRLRYTGAAVQKEIAGHYASGLEATLRVKDLYIERVAIRFLADDPFWYEIGESAVVLDSNDTATFRYCAGRLKSTGQWDDLGLTANPTGGPGTIEAIAIAPDGLVYFGGNFTGMNGVAGRDYIASYNRATDTWATVGGASDFNSSVNALVFGPDGTLYAGGLFTDAGGDGNADYVAKWDGVSWSAVAGGGSGTVNDLTFGLDGVLYICGSFTDWNAIGNADYIVSWDGSAYAALGTGLNGTAHALKTHPDGRIFVGGDFTTAGGVAAVRIAAWDPSASTWAAVGDGFNNSVRAFAIKSDGTIYAGGYFTALDGGAAGDYNRIAEYNGTAWLTMGANNGMNSNVDTLELAPDDILYAGGTFTQAGDITVADRVAKWNGASWAHLDVDLPGSPGIYGMAIGDPDPVIVNLYDIFLGFSTTGGGSLAGKQTVTNSGTMLCFPRIIVKRSGGTSAILETIRNETTGRELLFDYTLLDGEQLTIDLMPIQKSIISNFFGSRPDAILAGCDFGTFVLQPGDNEVTCFVSVAGSPTMTNYMIWRDAYKSQD